MFIILKRIVNGCQLFPYNFVIFSFVLILAATHEFFTHDHMIEQMIPHDVLVQGFQHKLVIRAAKLIKILLVICSLKDSQKEISSKMTLSLGNKNSERAELSTV